MASVHNDQKNRRNIVRNNDRKAHRLADRKKQKWVSEHKLQHGSLNEGLGFAFKRREKVKHEYNKLCRKQRKNKGEETFLTDKYPEHLEHLYLAEEQRQRNEELKKRHGRTERKTASMGKEEEEEDGHKFCPDNVSIITAADQAVCSDQTNNVSTQFPPASTPQSDRMKKRWKMTSYSQTKEDYEKQREERERKNEEYQKYTAAKEEALRKYKEKKKATYQLLKKKTKKGQPNLNAQMELLLQKIQDTKK
ncbi:thyroid transcription factor 1-associated protein 26 homolog [Alosa pseudoharengus]|uniref:thyroid transcription factor 1-associated protein 26 homolog n=1 Tax=Alosa pseudoharengus TaxID=34774 RepID=UPI003F8B887F